MSSCPAGAKKNHEKVSWIRRENPYQKVKELNAQAPPEIHPICTLCLKESVSVGDIDIPPHMIALKKQIGENKPPMIPHMVARITGDITEDVVFEMGIWDAYDF